MRSHPVLQLFTARLQRVLARPAHQSSSTAVATASEPTVLAERTVYGPRQLARWYRRSRNQILAMAFGGFAVLGGFMTLVLTHHNPTVESAGDKWAQETGAGVSIGLAIVLAIGFACVLLQEYLELRTTRAAVALAAAEHAPDDAYLSWAQREHRLVCGPNETVTTAPDQSENSERNTFFVHTEAGPDGVNVLLMRGPVTAEQFLYDDKSYAEFFTAQTLRCATFHDDDVATAAETAVAWRTEAAQLEEASWQATREHHARASLEAEHARVAAEDRHRTALALR